MFKKLAWALLALGIIAPAQAEVWQARYGVAETFNFKLYNADGTLDVDEADGGTEVSLSCNEGAETTATNDFADEGNFYSIALTATEMQCERVAVVIAATTTEVFFIQTSANASAMTPTYEVNVATITDGGIAAADFAAGAIDATAIAADAIGSSELAANSITSSEVADDAIDAGAIAADAIGASEIAASAIAASEIATDAIGAAEIAADAIDAAEINADVSTEFSAAVFTVNSTQISGDSAAADALETWLDGTTGQAIPLGIARQGTAQSATATTLVLDASSPFADDTPIGMTLVACGSTQGYCQSQAVTDYVNSTDTATIAGWPVTPSGTITFYMYATAPGVAGSLTAADVWTYVTRSLTVLDEDSTTIDLNASFVGGVTVFDEDTTTIDINATTLGTVSTVTSVSGFAAGAIDATAIAADAIGASEIATDAIGAAEIAAAAIGASEIATDAIGAAEIATDAIGTDETAIIDVNVEQMNGVTVLGAGTTADPWNGE